MKSIDKGAALKAFIDERGLKPMERQLEYFDAGYAAGQGLIPLTFKEVWKRMEAKGYKYGREPLANVRFGWELAHGMHMEPKAAPVDDNGPSELDIDPTKHPSYRTGGTA